MASLGFLFLLKPALLNRGGLTSGSLALNLDGLALVGLQTAGKIGLLGGLGRLGGDELLDVGLSVTGLDGLGLVGAELLEVQVLNRVGYMTLVTIDPDKGKSIIKKKVKENNGSTYPGGQRRSGSPGEGRQQTVAE